MKNVFLKDLLFIILLGLGLVIFFWPVLVGGQMYSTGGMINSDLILTDYPSAKVYKEALGKNQLPWWVSGIGNGYPLVAGGVLGAFYPTNLLLFRFFDVNTAFHLSILIQAWIAACGIYFLVKKLTKISAAAVFSAISFTLSGYMVTGQVTVNLFMTICLFPFIFLVFWELTEKFSTLKILLLGVLISLQIFAGYIPIAYYSWVVLFLTGLFKAGLNLRKQVQFLAFLVFGIAIASGICAIQLIPTWEFSKLSPRGGGISLADATLFIYPLEGFLSFLGIKSSILTQRIMHPTGSGLPEIKSFQTYYSYLGLEALFMLPFGVWSLSKKKQILVPFIGLVFVTFLLTLGRATPIFGWFWNLTPGMKLFRNSINFLGYCEFFLSIIAGLGFAYFVKNFLGKYFGDKRFLNLLVWVLVVLAFSDLYFHNRDINPVKDKNFWLEIPQVVYTISGKLDGARISTMNLSFSDLRYSDDWDLQDALRNFLPANYNMVFGLASIQERIPLTIVDHSMIEGAILPQELVGQAAIKQYEHPGVLDFPVSLTLGSYNTHLISGGKVIISPVALAYPQIKLIEKLPLPHPMEMTIDGYNQETGEIVKRKLAIDRGYVYEIEDSLSRAYIVPHAKFFNNQEKIFNYMLSENFKPKDEVLIRDSDKEEFNGGNGTARIIEDEQSKIKILAESDKGGWVYLSDTYYPGWKAAIDGTETKIYKANYAFRAVKMPTGEHRVEFVYDPLSRKAGVLISVITVLVLVIVAWGNQKWQLDEKFKKYFIT